MSQGIHNIARKKKKTNCYGGIARIGRHRSRTWGTWSAPLLQQHRPLLTLPLDRWFRCWLLQQCLGCQPFRPRRSARWPQRHAARTGRSDQSPRPLRASPPFHSVQSVRRRQRLLVRQARLVGPGLSKPRRLLRSDPPHPGRLEPRRDQSDRPRPGCLGGPAARGTLVRNSTGRTSRTRWPGCSCGSRRRPLFRSSVAPTGPVAPVGPGAVEAAPVAPVAPVGPLIDPASLVQTPPTFSVDAPGARVEISCRWPRYQRPVPSSTTTLLPGRSLRSDPPHLSDRSGQLDLAGLPDQAYLRLHPRRGGCGAPGGSGGPGDRADTRRWCCGRWVRRWPSGDDHLRRWGHGGELHGLTAGRFLGDDDLVEPLPVGGRTAQGSTVIWNHEPGMSWSMVHDAPGSSVVLAGITMLTGDRIRPAQVMGGRVAPALDHPRRSGHRCCRSEVRVVEQCRRPRSRGPAAWRSPPGPRHW